MRSSRLSAAAGIFLATLLLIIPFTSRPSQAAVPLSTPHTAAPKSAAATSVPYALTPVGNIGGTTATVAVSGTLAYVGEGAALTIVNIANPALPVRLGSLKTTGYVQEIRVVGTVAYLSDQVEGLVIADVSNPALPTRLSSYRPANSAAALALQVSGNYAYINFGSILAILDIRDPRHPQLMIKRYFDWIYDLDIVGTRLFMAQGVNRFAILDVSNPAAPQVVNDTNYLQGIITGVQVIGDIAYVINNSALVVLNVADPTRVRTLGSKTLARQGKDITVANGRAFVTHMNGTGLVEIFDITQPQQISLLGSYSSAQQIWDVRVAPNGTYAYLANDTAGLTILNLTTIASPTLVGSYDQSWAAQGIDIVDQIAYVAAGRDGIAIVDLHTPASPVLLSTTPMTGNAVKIKVVNQRAYVANSFGTVDILNVADPIHPMLLSRTGEVNAYNLHVVNNLIYVAGARGLFILDATDLTSPTITTLYTQTYGLRDINILGTTLYASFDESGSGGGLVIMDITNPTSPTLRSKLYTGKGRGLDVVGSTAYVADIYYQGGLQLIDVSNPVSPTLLATQKAIASAVDVQVVDQIAYVGREYIGTPADGAIELVDVSNRSQPQTLAYYVTAQGVQQLQVSGNLIYTVEGGAGLKILQTTPLTNQRFLPLLQR